MRKYIVINEKDLDNLKKEEKYFFNYLLDKIDKKNENILVIDPDSKYYYKVRDIIKEYDKVYVPKNIKTIDGEILLDCPICDDIHSDKIVIDMGG